MKYRKKPIIIEAFQITKESRQSNHDWPSWLHEAWQEGTLYPASYGKSNGKDMLMIKTLEGDMLVDWNDWVIQGIKGEIYPCKPDIFEATYDPVT